MDESPCGFERVQCGAMANHSFPQVAMFTLIVIIIVIKFIITSLITELWSRTLAGPSHTESTARRYDMTHIETVVVHVRERAIPTERMSVHVQEREEKERM